MDAKGNVTLANFLVVKVMNRIIRKAADAPPAPAADVVLLQEIRDILKTQKSVP